MTENKQTEDYLNDIIANLILGVNTCVPGVIKKKHDYPFVDVQPLFQQVEEDLEGNEVIVDRPIINNVPVAQLGYGKAFVSFPYNVGDPVLLIIAQRSIDNYLFSTDGTKTLDPKENRHHDINDAICLVGMVTQSKKNTNAGTDDIVLGFDDGSLFKITTGREIIADNISVMRVGGSGASQSVALASPTSSKFSSIETQHNVHVHIGNLGYPTLVPVAPMTLTGDIASGKLKTDG